MTSEPEVAFEPDQPSSPDAVQELTFVPNHLSVVGCPRVKVAGSADSVTDGFGGGGVPPPPGLPPQPARISVAKTTSTATADAFCIAFPPYGEVLNSTFLASLYTKAIFLSNVDFPLAPRRAICYNAIE